MSDLQTLALEKLADGIGMDAALALADHFGGRRLYVPKRAGEHHPIAVALGREHADALTAWAGGEAIDVPKQAARRAKVLALRARGTLTAGQIATETGYSERHVYRLGREADAAAQPDLFEDSSNY